MSSGKENGIKVSAVCRYYYVYAKSTFIHMIVQNHIMIRDMKSTFAWFGISTRIDCEKHEFKKSFLWSKSNNALGNTWEKELDCDYFQLLEVSDCLKLLTHFHPYIWTPTLLPAVDMVVALAVVIVWPTGTTAEVVAPKAVVETSGTIVIFWEDAGWLRQPASPLAWHSVVDFVLEVVIVVGTTGAIVGADELDKPGCASMCTKGLLETNRVTKTVGKWLPVAKQQCQVGCCSKSKSVQ